MFGHLIHWETADWPFNLLGTFMVGHCFRVPQLAQRKQSQAPATLPKPQVSHDSSQVAPSPALPPVAGGGGG